MHRSDFAYDLPEELIAYKPAAQRSDSRLLSLEGVTGQKEHLKFVDILDKLYSGDLLVLNNTKVIPARIFGRKASGGKLEILVERLLSDAQVLAHIRSSKSPKPNSEILLENGQAVRVVGREGSLFLLDFGLAVIPFLETYGHMPLPPYIDRSDTAEDQDRYQTVYGTEVGAVAAPTAGLHFDDALLAAIEAKGVRIAYVTLHVGAGTFQPVRVDDIQEHTMHSEWMTLSQEVCDLVKQTHEAGRRVVAVGTTSVRCLETAGFHSNGDLQPYEGDTDIFIYPGYEFQVVDALITNFHLSESTLMMLVSAFAGYQNIMSAYQDAIERRYRFFSYGDAMFLTRNPEAPNEIIPRRECS